VHLPEGTVNAETVLRLLAAEARPMILAGWGPESCAVSTRIALDVCRAVGVSAKPLAVAVMAFNEPAWPLFLDGVPVHEWPPEAWSVGIDPEERSHVVALVEGTTLLDLSADQLDRPEKRLRVPEPVVARVGPAFLTDGDHLGLSDDEGTRLLYRRGGDLNWLHRSPDWTERRRRASIVGALVRRLREV
jgi:hypothetical protein